MFLIVQPTPPGGLARGDEEVTQTHAVSSKASLQPTHVPVKSRGSPVGHRGDTREGPHHGSETCPHLPPPCPPHRVQGRRDQDRARVPFPTITLGLLSDCWESPPCTSPTVPKPAPGTHPSRQEPATRRPSWCWATERPGGRSGTQLLLTAS